MIQISGGDGGTGASPLSSIKSAGCPWELGLAETHSALVLNGLRERVLLRVDGGFRTGRDVIIGALLGAEEYGFGTIAMISEGCVMARVCHLNTCPVGVTSQKEELRKKFPGTPEHVVNFFTFVAEEVRHLLAHLGYQKLEDIIGRADLLTQSAKQRKRVAKTQGIDLAPFFSGVPSTSANRSFLRTADGRKKTEVVHINGFSSDLDREICNHETIKKVIVENSGQANVAYRIANTDRSICAMLSGDIARAHGNRGFKGKVTLEFSGSAGQSFGAFLLPGLDVRLVGEANDYVGKGMHGGEITVVPSDDSNFIAADSSIVGNACLYGATGGVFHAYGKAGERFCVRNSGAIAVIEGTGDHCCEYMTGGIVVVLGSVGRNVGAGMTGGIGYFYDPENEFEAKLNTEIVKKQRISTNDGRYQLKSLIEAHFQKTGSERAEKILDSWEAEVNNFWQIFPPSEANTPAVKEVFIVDTVRSSAPNGEQCFLPIGGSLTPEQVARCAD